MSGRDGVKRGGGGRNERSAPAALTDPCPCEPRASASGPTRPAADGVKIGWVSIPPGFRRRRPRKPGSIRASSSIVGERSSFPASGCRRYTATENDRAVRCHVWFGSRLSNPNRRPHPGVPAHRASGVLLAAGRPNSSSAAIFRYVPVTWTGLAGHDFVKFAFLVSRVPRRG